MPERNPIDEALERFDEHLEEIKEEMAKSTAPDIGEELVSNSVLARRFRNGTPEFRRQQLKRMREEMGDEAGQQAALRLLGKR